MKKKRNKKQHVMTTIFFITAIFFTLTSANAGEMLRWTGCGITKKAFMLEVAKEYMKKTGIIIKLSGGGATKGIREANNGNADIGGSCRPSLRNKFPAKEGDAYMTLVAWDALVPIVNKNNPVGSITSQQMKDIFLGKITNWKDVGGPDKKILVVARKGKISGVGFSTRIIIFKDANIDYTPNAMLLKSSGPVENKVQHDPLAIGITGISSAKKRVKAGKPIKILKVDGKKANVANIGSGQYPTYRPLYLITKGKPTGIIKDFMNWVVSAEGQKIVESVGTVSIRQGRGLKRKFKYWINTSRILNYNALP